jgi:hypothetical protein
MTTSALLVYDQGEEDARIGIAHATAAVRRTTLPWLWDGAWLLHSVTQLLEEEDIWSK